MIRRLALIFTLLWPAMVQAQTVAVNSGEHTDFSRILLQMQTEDGWRFGRVEGGYEFRAANPEITYDLETAFDLIPRTRIAALRDRGEGRLFFAVDCDCHADAFVFRNGHMVLDIIDGAAPTADWPFEARLDPPSRAPAAEDPAVETASEAAGQQDAETAASPPTVDTQAPEMMEPIPATDATASPDMPVAQVETEPVLDEEAPHSEAVSTTPHTNDRGGLPLTTMSREAENGLRFGPLRDYVPSDGPQTGSTEAQAAATRSHSDHVQETQNALLEQIARAAAQGLIDADLGKIEAGVAGATGQPTPTDAENPFPSVPNTDDSHIKVETGIDMAAALHGPQSGATDDGTACINPALFDIRTWGEPVDDGIDLGAHRSRVVGEFDAPDTEGLTDLVRYYIFLTFGAEARALIKKYPDVVSHPAVLYVMADVMDNDRAAAAPSLEKQMACDGATALWATLAQPELKPGQTINAKAVTLTFSALPKHLRRHLGPQLAEKFLALGDQGTADVIHRAFGRVAEPNDSSTEMVDAEFDIADGQVDLAINRLDTVVANADDNLPEALLRRVNTTLDKGDALPIDTVTLLESLLFEQRGTEIGKELIDANIRARGSVRDFHTAFELLRSAIAENEVTEDRAVELRQILFGQLATNSADASFLRRIIGHMDQVVQMPAENRRPIAKRFLDLSLPGPARQVLDGTGTGVPEKADRLLYAEAALLDEHPDVAIGYLAGLHGEVADALRAQALAKAGDYVAATTTYESIGDNQEALANAWRGGLWPSVTKLDENGPQGAAATLMETPAPQTPDTPIAKSEALIENSQSVRQTLDTLLLNVEPLSAQ